MTPYLDPPDDPDCDEFGHAPVQYACGCVRCQVCDAEIKYCGTTDCIVYPLNGGHDDQPPEIPF